ncbi:uncharacterized protein LOC5510519 isoform X4 [Nematostella vectensis]|uniref:uncharacterized protein LOC5510519 isoform X4 n=1 Tax=Nematostella vectensis TaxID=45351 RepID=UPI0020773520|nr:uncharacterized protein LOC5510519 isoform X4 [Nematostella vectensis]
MAMKLIPLALLLAVHCTRALEWEALGCYKDSWSRTMPNFFKKIKYDKKNPNFQNMFEQCRVEAEKLGYTYFGLQNMKECWGSPNGRETYNTQGCNDNCERRSDGKFGAGTNWSNFIYRVKKDWTDCSAKVCGDGVQYKLVLSQDKGPKCPFYNVLVKRSDKTRKCSAAKSCGERDYETLGCYEDSFDRGLPKYLGNVGPFVAEKKNFEEVFNQCKTKAKAAGLFYFGVQDDKECWAGDLNAKYNKHGCKGNCITDPSGLGVGRTWSNYVYMFKQEWSLCTKTCGGGEKQKYESELATGDASCSDGTRKSVLKKAACNTDPCAVDGGWSDYSSWSLCTKSCGGGTRTRTRTCTNPKPSSGGKDCVGDDKQTRECGKAPCPVNGGWSEFSEWTKCTKTCGGGKQERTRTCTNPSPSNGGKDCVGDAKEEKDCNTDKCPPKPCSPEDIVNKVVEALPKGDATINNRLISAVIQVVKAMDNEIPKNVKVTEEEMMERLVKAAKHKGREYARMMLGFILQKQDDCHGKSDKIIDDIKKNLGDDDFKDFLAVNGDVSLIFTIDTTGSMKDEINAAKAIVKAIAGYDRKGKVDYILSPYSDPGSGPVSKFDHSKRSQFESQINALRAYGGGDCNELTFNGIVDAIRTGQPEVGSPMYVFTDAPPKAKGEYNRDTSIGLALDYMIPVNFFFSTKGCGNPGKNADYKSIIEDTGGIGLFFNNAAAIASADKIVRSDLDGSTIIAAGGSSAFKGRRDLLEMVRRAADSVKTFHVDESVDKLTVYISATLYADRVSLRDPSNKQVSYTMTMNGGLLWFIEKPKVGKWQIVVPGFVRNFAFQVKSSSIANNQFDVEFTKLILPAKFVVSLKHPLKGEKANAKIIIPQISRVDESSLKLKIVHSGGETDLAMKDYKITFDPPDSPFKFILTGRTHDSNEFQRLSRETFTAGEAFLRSQIKSDLLTIKKGMEANHRFVLHNNGPTNTFEITASMAPTTGVRISKLSAKSRTVTKNRYSYIAVYLEAHSSVPVGTPVTLYITAKGRSRGVQTSLVSNLIVY